MRQLLSAAILAGLTLSFSTPAEAEFGVGADVVSRYVWRGALLDDNLSVQPFLSYRSEMGAGSIEFGAWGSFAAAASGANENDLYITYSTGPITLTLTDYYFPNGDKDGDGKNDSDFFEYGDKEKIHQLEILGSFAQGPIGITGAAILSGDPDTPIYVEGSYELMSDDDISASVTAALGTEAYYTSDGDPALINVGLSVSKGDYTAQYILNPDAEQSWMVFMMSF